MTFLCLSLHLNDESSQSFTLDSKSVTNKHQSNSTLANYSLWQDVSKHTTLDDRDIGSRSLDDLESGEGWIFFLFLEYYSPFAAQFSNLYHFVAYGMTFSGTCDMMHLILVQGHQVTLKMWKMDFCSFLRHYIQQNLKTFTILQQIGRSLQGQIAY